MQNEESVATDETEANGPQSRRQKELASTRKLLSQASHLIANVEESYIMQKHGPRQYPTFSASEIVRGPLLGVGGFGIVWEIKDFKLSVPKEVELHISIDSNANSIEDEKKEMNSELKDGSAIVQTTQAATRSEGGTSSTSETQQNEQQEQTSEERPQRPEDLPTEEIMMVIAPDDSHYDVKDARFMMSKQVRRKGSARYAIKKLHSDLNDLERARGMIDMALEVKYLSVLWHPNIVKMRGYAAGPILNPNFFIIMDRLYEVLDAKIKTWSVTYKQNRGGLFGSRANKLKLQELLVERLVVAYDLAAAFWYMHQNKLVYRDIKQENIGFDIRGDVKVFDFGLSKSLSPSLKEKDSYGYRLTPRTGSVPYMAPEVAECQPYSTECDVFSFSILMWEILSMKPAFKGYSRREFLVRVIRGRERQNVPRKWPPLTRLAVREAWEHDPQKRPDMKRIAALLRGDLNELSSDPEVQDRTRHMRERSSHSTRLARAWGSRSGSTK